MTTFLSGAATSIGGADGTTSGRAGAEGALAGQGATPPLQVDVMFPLQDDEDWPPYPAEVVEAALLSHDLVEITGVPWFANGISRGDIVHVSHDGIGYVGGPVVSRGGHSTVHVMAGSQQEMAPIAAALRALGADSHCGFEHSGFEPAMLTADVPPQCSMDSVIEVLRRAESASCAFALASCQHRAVRPDF
jgi:hypothetical protein